MSREINFVAARSKKLTEAQLRDKKFLRIGLIGLAVIFVLFLISVGGRFYFVYQVNQVKTQQENTRQAIANQEDVEKEYNIFAHKLKQLSLLFGKRKDKQDAIAFFTDIFPQEILVSGIDYSASQNDILSFTVRAPNVFSLDQVFDILKTDQVLEKYPVIEKSGLKRTGEGTYVLKLTVFLGGKVIPEEQPGVKSAPKPEEGDESTEIEES